MGFFVGGVLSLVGAFVGVLVAGRRFGVGALLGEAVILRVVGELLGRRLVPAVGGRVEEDEMLPA